MYRVWCMSQNNLSHTQYTILRHPPAGARPHDARFAGASPSKADPPLTEARQAVGREPAPCKRRICAYMTKKDYSCKVGGRTLSVRFPNWAEQASGSALVQYGDTVVLATAVMAKNPREGGDFFPLMVDYDEKYYSTGEIRGSRFVKREGRPNDEAILTARMIDRSLRPLFDQSIRNDVQIAISVLSDDKINNPDIPAFIAASLSLHVSDIPWSGPVAAVRVGKEKSSWVLNPQTDTMAESPVEIIVAGTGDLINMLEAEGKEIPEDEMQQAIEFGYENLKEIIEFENTIRKEVGKEKRALATKSVNEDLKAFIATFQGELEKALFVGHKQERLTALQALEENITAKVAEKYPQNPEYLEAAADMMQAELDRLVHKGALDDSRRVDGRKFDELRQISGEVSVLPRTHGSALFMRGLTHTLSAVTLGAPNDAQIVENPRGEYKKHFMHHYTFPSFSTGETGMSRGPGRREIGHGALAEKALRAIIPNQEEFPYTIRIVSETLSSNGSSSMAATTASAMALMDAGVPIVRPVAGIAIGLMSRNGEYKIVTDIQGPEDHHGDMDFKVAGSRSGITAIQMDVKIGGITPAILRETLAQGRKARLEILDVVESVIPGTRPNLSPFAPLIETIVINPDKIGMVIGSGGKTINEIIAKTDTEINVENDGKVYVIGKNKDDVKKAREWIEGIVHEAQIGELYKVKVVRIEDFGAFVEFMPGKEGLIHVSELAEGYVKNVRDVVKMGDQFQAIVIRVDAMGKVALSKKQVLTESKKKPS